MPAVDDLFSLYARSYDAHRNSEMSLPEYLDACRADPHVEPHLDRDRLRCREWMRQIAGEHLAPSIRAVVQPEQIATDIQ